MELAKLRERVLKRRHKVGLVHIEDTDLDALRLEECQRLAEVRAGPFRLESQWGDRRNLCVNDDLGYVRPCQIFLRCASSVGPVNESWFENGTRSINWERNEPSGVELIVSIFHKQMDQILNVFQFRDLRVMKGRNTEAAGTLSNRGHDQCPNRDEAGTSDVRERWEHGWQAFRSFDETRWLFEIVGLSYVLLVRAVDGFTPGSPP